MINAIENMLSSEPFIFGCVIGAVAVAVACAAVIAWYCHLDRSGLPRRGDLWAVKAGNGENTIYVRIRHASHSAVIYSVGEAKHTQTADMANEWNARRPVLVKRRRFWLF